MVIQVRTWKKKRAALLVVALIPLTSLIQAQPQYSGIFDNLYPDSQTLGNAYCSICHNGSVGLPKNKWVIYHLTDRNV